MKQQLLISFSGGLTSGYMTKRLLDDCGDQFEMKIAFANTGQENEKTLIFVDRFHKSKYGDLHLAPRERVSFGKLRSVGMIETFDGRWYSITQRGLDYVRYLSEK